MTYSNNNLLQIQAIIDGLLDSLHTGVFIEYPNPMLNVYDIKRSDFIR